MRINRSLKGAFATVTFVTLAVMAMCAPSAARTMHNDEFVQRDGTRLTLGGETFALAGPASNGSAWKPAVRSIPWASLFQPF
jgi:hypothetical protein